MNIELLTEVKIAIGLVGDFSNDVLLEKLYTTRNQSHPDKFTDASIKAMQEEKFKTLNGLIDRFKAYLEKERANSQPAIYDENKTQELSRIKNIIEFESIRQESEELKRKVDLLEYQVGEAKDKQDEKKKQNQEAKAKVITESLNNIYKIKGVASFSVVSFIALVFSQLEYVKYQIEKLFVIDSCTVNYIMILVFTLSFLWLIYKMILKQRINYYMCRFTNPLILSQIRLNHKHRPNYREDHFVVTGVYIRESDIYEYIRGNIRGFDRILFSIDIEVINRELFNYVILHLNKKQVILRTEPTETELIFVLNKKPLENQ